VFYHLVELSIICEQIFYYYIILYDFQYLSVSIILFPRRYRRSNLSHYHLNRDKFQTDFEYWFLQTDHNDVGYCDCGW
jgi:hypothetical protein